MSGQVAGSGVQKGGCESYRQAAVPQTRRGRHLPLLLWGSGLVPGPVPRLLAGSPQQRLAFQIGSSALNSYLVVKTKIRTGSKRPKRSVRHQKEFLTTWEETQTRSHSPTHPSLVECALSSGLKRSVLSGHLRT